MEVWTLFKSILERPLARRGLGRRPNYCGLSNLESSFCLAAFRERYG